jgi:DNA-binding response OmpR family regulator
MIKMAKKILIVDDEKDAVEFLGKNLQLEGFEVAMAYDGIEAKEKIVKENPAIIILDIIMPRLDGWEVLQWLRKEAKLSTPTIILSAKEDVADLKRSYRLETDTYLVKPASINDILKAINIITALEVKKE